MFVKIIEKVRRSVLPTLFWSAVVGFVTAFIVFFFNYTLEHLSALSLKIYSYVKGHLVFLPLLFLGAAALALFIGYTVKLIPEATGGGIPCIEGVSRGKLTLRWFLALPAMFIASCASIFTGLSLGGEGPSVFMGGAAGYGISKISKLRRQELRTLTSAGACSGLAVAFGAPLSGIMFSVEEAHRRFSPSILLPAVVSVITSMLTVKIFFGTGIYLDYGHIAVDVNLSHIIGAFAVGLVSGGLGCLFNAAVTRKNAHLDRIPKQFKVLIPAALAVIAGLLLPQAIGGGKLILKDIAGLAAAGALLPVAVFLLKFVLTAASSRSGASGGLFIPMLALGALCGTTVSILLKTIGLENNIIYLSLMGAGAFFAASVRAPLTAVVLIFEITLFDVSAILGIVIAVGSAFLISELMKSKPLYESLLEMKLIQNGVYDGKNEKTDIPITVSAGSYAVKRYINEIILPAKSIITTIVRDGVSVVPDASTRIEAEDILIISCEEISSAAVRREAERLFN